MHTKRIAAGYGKRPKWIVTPHGPHKREDSVPLLLVVRDMLGYADTEREARKIIISGMVLVDGRPMKDPNFGVGLMDVVEIPKTNEVFRVLPSKKKSVLKPVDKKEAGIKLCRVVGKKVLGVGKFQVSLHDGSCLVLKENKYRVKDTLVLQLPERKVIDCIEFGEGKQGFIVSGRHRGESGRIESITAGTAVQHSLTKIGDLQTRTDYIFVVGKDKPMISL